MSNDPIITASDLQPIEKDVVLLVKTVINRKAASVPEPFRALIVDMGEEIVQALEDYANQQLTAATVAGTTTAPK